MKRPRFLQAPLRLLVALAGAYSCVARGGTDPISVKGDVDVDVVEQTPAPDKPIDYFVVPIPSANPTLGAGLDLVGMLLYKIDANSPDSSTALAGAYTSNHSWAVGALEKTYFDSDRFRISGGGGYGSVNYDFFGVGSTNGDAGISIPLREVAAGAFIDARMRVWNAIYAGIRYSFVDVKTELPDNIAAVLPFPQPAAIDISLNSVGLVASYDSRDQQYSPHHGLFIDFKSLFSVSRRGDNATNYQSYKLAANYYASLGTLGILASRVSVCDVSASTPFFELCMYGANSDLRGYETGRYLDHFLVASQVEFRRDLTERFGAVIFGGAGTVAPDIQSLGSSKLLPSGGLGLRYIVAPSQGIKLSVDFAWARGSQGLYVYIGDSF